MRSSTFSLRFTEIGPLDLVGPRVKAHLIGEGTKIKEFRRNSRFRIFRKSKVSGLGSVHGTS